MLLLFPGTASCQSDSLPEAVREQIRTRIEAERRGLDALVARGQVVHTTASVLQFYEERGFDPVWVGGKGPTPAVDTLVAALQRADREGLMPKNYHVGPIATLLREGRESNRLKPGILSDLELLCTDAFLLYASHLLSGHLSATEITPTWNVPHRQADLLRLLAEVAEGESVTAAFASVRPPQPEYDALVDALRRYRAIAAKGGWATVPDGPTLERGATGERVARLRDRLADVNGGPSTPFVETAAPEFGGVLHEAVVAFQERHGLNADGVVGLATHTALNVSVERRIQQLIVNLERWRWMPQTLGDRHVLVNIAAAHLRLVENGEDVLTMRVVTGLPYRQTPVFSGEISYLVLNPYWHVPHSIASQDKLPIIQKDSSYLEKQQFKVFQDWGADAQPIDPSTVDWDSLSETNFPYRLRQDPGPLNALGGIKFMFPNPHSVYLHDTPTRGFFARSDRNVSSGCIRLEHPIELAEHLLADHGQWPPERIRSTLKTSAIEQSVALRTRMPVHLQYWTAWAEANGTVHFRKDAYQRDGAVQNALTSASPTE